MPLKRLPYRRIEPLIRKHLSTVEDETTVRLIRALRVANERGYLTRGELAAICYWKSPRAIRYIRANSRQSVRAVTRTALASRSEGGRLEALTGLRGVSVPMASAVLTLLNPRRYGVIDIRVWQLLHRLGTVERNAAGVGLSSSNWHEFLVILRHFAKKFGVKARDIERTLFEAHVAYQRGRLYR